MIALGLPVVAFALLGPFHLVPTTIVAAPVLMHVGPVLS